MKISEYIVALEMIKDEHGALEVDSDWVRGRRTVAVPVIAFRKILSKRESKDEFWDSYLDESAKGEKVCRV